MLCTQNKNQLGDGVDENMVLKSLKMWNGIPGHIGLSPSVEEF